MREVRKPEEVVTDKALLLVLMDLAGSENEKAFVGDRLKCMKLPFFAANQMFEQKAKGFNLTFFRYEHGPLSKEVYSAWNHLLLLGLLVEDRRGFRVTPEGSRLAQAVLADMLSIQANKFFKETIENVASRYGRLSTPRIMQIAYDFEVSLPRSGSRMKMREIESGEDIILILDEDEAKLTLKLAPSWMETLAIELNPKNKEGLLRAFDDYKKGRILSHEEVWRNVNVSS
jgi:uncharacterized phage-associated protein